MTDESPANPNNTQSNAPVQNAPQSNTPQNWYGNASPDAQKFYGNYKTPDDLYNRYREAIIPISEKTTPNEISEYYGRLGVPKSADLYDVKEKFSDENLNKQILDIFHKNNIPNNSANGLISALKAMAQNDDTNEKTALETTNNSVRELFSKSEGGQNRLNELNQYLKTLGDNVPNAIERLNIDPQQKYNLMLALVHASQSGKNHEFVDGYSANNNDINLNDYHEVQTQFSKLSDRMNDQKLSPKERQKAREDFTALARAQSKLKSRA